jgi:hypothetical protein
MLCPLKMIGFGIQMRGLTFPDIPNNKNWKEMKSLNWQCEGIDCEWFNEKLGKCVIYLLSASPSHRVDLNKNKRRKG